MHAIIRPRGEFKVKVDKVATVEELNLLGLLQSESGLVIGQVKIEMGLHYIGFIIMTGQKIFLSTCEQFPQVHMGTVRVGKIWEFCLKYSKF